jgi:hypothetical protein
MFLAAQLNCRSKLGAKLSSYYMWREGGPHLFNAPAGRYLYKKWRCDLGFKLDTLEHEKVLFSLSTVYTVRYL